MYGNGELLKFKKNSNLEIQNSNSETSNPVSSPQLTDITRMKRADYRSLKAKLNDINDLNKAVREIISLRNVHYLDAELLITLVKGNLSKLSGKQNSASQNKDLSLNIKRLEDALKHLNKFNKKKDQQN